MLPAQMPGQRWFSGSATKQTDLLADGPNKKSRLLDLIQLPESLDDAMLQPASTATQQTLPADEAQRQLGTLQLGSGDEPASPKPTDVSRAIQIDAAAPTLVKAATDTMVVDNPSSTPHLVATTVTPSGQGTTAATDVLLDAEQAKAEAATGAYKPDGPLLPETSPEPGPSDAAVAVVSGDAAVDSSAQEGQGGDEGEGEVASRQVESAAPVCGNGAGEGRAGGYEVFIGGLPPDAREEDVRGGLSEMAQSEVLSVRLQMTRGTSICKGYGFATFADEAAAQRAASAAAGGARLCGQRVGLHASKRPFRAVLATAQAAGTQPPLPLSPDSDASINELLRVLREHPDRRAARLTWALPWAHGMRCALRLKCAALVVQRGAKRAYPASAGAAAQTSGGAAAAAVPAAATGPQQRPVAEAKRQATAATVAAAAAAAPAPASEPCAAAPQTGGGSGQGEVNEGGGAPKADVAAVPKADATTPRTDAPAATPATEPTPTEEAPAAPAAVPAKGEEASKAAPAGKKQVQAAAPGPASATATGKGGKKGTPGEKAAGTAGSSGAGRAAAVAGTSGGGASAGGGSSNGGGGGGSAPGAMSPDLTTALAAYPKINKLINSLKGTPRPKTPLMILHEYASKMSYEVTNHETSDGPSGPYTVETRMLSGGNRGTTIATASGKARTKKDAKQVSAAAVLEKLLDGPRGVSPQDLLPLPKPAAAAPAAARGPGRRAEQERGGGRKGRSGAGPGAGGGGPPQPQHAHIHHRDALNRTGQLPPPSMKPPPPPPPPSFHGGLRSGGPPFGGGGGGGGGHLGPMSRAPFSGGGGGGGTSYSAVQPGLMPASHSAASGFGGLGRNGGGDGGGRGQWSGGDSYDGPGYGNLGYGNSGGSGGGGGGSMVQLGLSSSGRDSNSRGGGGLGMDSYGAPSSYDMAAGQKRNYSTAMQVRFADWEEAAYGSPAASQGLLPVNPPQQPAAGAVGALMGGGGVGVGLGGAQDPFAAQAGGVSRGGGLGGSGAIGSGTAALALQHQSFNLGQPAVQSNIYGMSSSFTQGQAQQPQQQQYGSTGMYSGLSQLHGLLPVHVAILRLFAGRQCTAREWYMFISDKAGVGSLPSRTFGRDADTEWWLGKRGSAAVPAVVPDADIMSSHQCAAAMCRTRVTQRKIAQRAPRIAGWGWGEVGCAVVGMLDLDTMRCWGAPGESQTSGKAVRDSAGGSARGVRQAPPISQAKGLKLAVLQRTEQLDGNLSDMAA
ncbi:hypothetical protein VOLCADRAFT_96996 [Volvox carteri f. nagariensis]|uniref:RRM domain-containing protein n=1 Tax=Volvox carteri f. nagariensis TaxID=3068 RepID=D8UBL8_VOLCA|nr:uncharacterized protein VOLCADRAFT_96996 [Volvox carteri f. nagariensis]EFJ42790.1 hypothetical protein VOLCADRAFT_96996 [Volvox carteri f. nagariensis]|eukprot:XP_002956050.1 hypothetical protein VOLCADRAFT_96996 [Volvox carteri f. nagariensis]